MRLELSQLCRMFPLDWSMRRSYRLPTDDLGQPYYIEWSGAPLPAGEGWDLANFTFDGVILTEGAPRPVATAQYALTQYRAALNGDADSRKRFLAQAAYLVRSQRADGAYVHEGLKVPWYIVPDPFVSAQAQGEAASVLLRAYSLTSEPQYLECARHALAPMLLDTREGGVSYIRGNDVFFEELATPEPCHILNGHLYGAFALWEFIRFDLVGKEYVELHDSAIRTCERWLSHYDAGGWSCYDLAVDRRGRPHYANLWYHQFHIAQLQVYAAMTGRRSFALMSERWNAAQRKMRVRAQVWSYGLQSALDGIGRRLVRRPFTPFRPLAASVLDDNR